MALVVEPFESVHAARRLYIGRAMPTTYFFSEGPLTYLSPVAQVSGLPVVTQVSADDYLAYAKSDLQINGSQGSINALGNAKRSLHLMIDTLLQNYGLLAQNPRLRFPDKLALLDDVGLISLNVFRRLNVERNLAEHEYTVPSREQVEDFVDVCHLLRLAMEHLGESIPCRAAVGIRESEEHVLLALEPALGRLDIYDLIDPSLEVDEAFGKRVEYVSTTLNLGERYPNAALSGEPSRSIPLTHKRRAEWLPLLTEFVSANPTNNRATVVRDGVATISLTRDVVLENIPDTSLFRMLGLGPGVVEEHEPSLPPAPE